MGVRADRSSRVFGINYRVLTRASVAHSSFVRRVCCVRTVAVKNRKEKKNKTTKSRAAKKNCHVRRPPVVKSACTVLILCARGTVDVPTGPINKNY